MGPNQDRAAAKRQQIVDSARQLFVENGFAGSSMDGIVAHAGVSKQTLYRYFASKNDLLAAVLANEVDGSGIFPPSPPAIETPDDLRAALFGIARTVTDQMMQADRMAVMRLIFGEAVRIPDLRDALRDALPGQMLGLVAALLNHANDRELIHTPRPELAARLFIGSMFSYIALDGLLRAEPLPPPPASDLQAIVDLFLRSVEVGQ